MNDKINQLCSDCFLQFVEMHAGDHVGFMFTFLIGQPRISANRIHSYRKYSVRFETFDCAAPAMIGMPNLE